MGGLPSSRIGLETLQTKLDDFSFESYIGVPANSPDMPIDVHSQMESKLKLGTKVAARPM
jgi:hypothetical protein